MYQMKTFTLEAARALLPRLKEMLSAANQRLVVLGDSLKQATERYESAEAKLAKIKAPSQGAAQLKVLRTARQDFEQAVKDVSQCKEEYLDCLTAAIEEITSTGVILRDLHTGLLDFPARQGEVEYFLCWRLGEDDIDYWHLVDDGFAGRRSLAVLSEYF